MAASTKKLYRSEKNKVIGGVAGGLGEYLGIDPILIRILFLISILGGGFGIFVYLVMWLLIPSKGNVGKSTEQVAQANAEEMAKAAKDFGKRMEGTANSKNAPVIAGIVLIGFGILLLLWSLGFFDFFNLSRVFWPLVVIVIGLLIITRKV